MNTFLRGFLATLFVAYPAFTQAGGWRSCGGCYSYNNYYPQVRVKKVVDVEFASSYITFVPSQVLLNGQVTTYGTAVPSALTYSYQGPSVSAATQTQDQGVSLEERVARIESYLQQLSEGGSVSPQTAASGESASSAAARTYFKQSCLKCHAPGGTGFFALEMFDSAGELLPKLPRLAIMEAIHKHAGEQGFMPKGGAEATDVQKESVRAWTQEGLAGLNY